MYLIGRRRIAELVHLAATDESACVVLDPLFTGAFAAVCGRMMPRLLPELTTTKSFFRHGAWTLVRSKHKDLLDAFQTDRCT